MKDVRPKFTDDEYDHLINEANQLQISVQKLVHDRAISANPSNSPLYGALILSDGMASIRADLNRIIRRETEAEIRLYEDDVIRLEGLMTELEQMVVRYIADALREVRAHGQPAV